MNRRALVRRPSPRLAEGLLTHIERVPVDVDLALRQWDGYVAALHAEGWDTIEVPPSPDCPDSVFVEDTVVMCGDLAVITRPGADERKPEEGGTPENPLPLPPTPGDLSQLGAAITGKAGEPEPPANALFPEELAAILKTTPAALAQERYRGGGIPYVKWGARIRYLAADVAAYLADNRRQGTAADHGTAAVGGR